MGDKVDRTVENTAQTASNVAVKTTNSRRVVQGRRQVATAVTEKVTDKQPVLPSWDDSDIMSFSS